MKKVYQVVAGVIMQNDCILCGKRGKGVFESKWELPGGKVEAGETKEEALRREIREEIGYQLGHSTFFMAVDAAYEEFTIHLDTYLSDGTDCKPVANVHQELKWVKLPDLSKYDWCDADKAVIDAILCYGIEQLRKMMVSQAT